RIRSVLLRTGRIDDQEDSREEASFNPSQDNKAIIMGRVKSIQRKVAFHSLVLSWHTPPTSTPQLRGDQKRSFIFPPSSALTAFLNKPSSLLCVAFLIEVVELTPKAKFYGRERYNNNCAIRDFFKYCKRKGLLIELGGEAILVIRSERGLARKLAPLKSHYLIRICYARYADDLLLGIVGAVELLIEIKKLLAHFLQSGLNLWVGSAGSTTIAARSTVEFLGTVIREVPPRTTPIQFLRELEKRLRVKHRIHITACHLRSAIHSKFRNLGNSIPIKELTKGMSGTGSLLDAVQLADTLGTAGVRSPQVGVRCRLVTLDGDGVDWAAHAEDEQENFALMAHSNSGSNTEVTSCLKECKESYAKFKKLYDEQREQLGDASIEIQAYTQALKKMSVKDKSGLGYGDQIHEGVLSYENEVLRSVFDNESMFTYGLKQSKTSESDAKTSNSASSESNSSVETLESVPKLVVNEPKAVSEPKVWFDAPIIELYESNSDDEYVFKALVE
ncbi:hypothetical protein Tco_0221464, partial [Tanacetum coccineum]